MWRDKADEVLSESMESLYRSKKYSDFTIVCGDDIYPVHKAIICPRSDFFAAAVNFGKEATDNRIDLSSDEPKIVELMIQYFYGLYYEYTEPKDTMYLLTEFERLNTASTKDEIVLRQKIIELLAHVSEDGMQEALNFTYIGWVGADELGNAHVVHLLRHKTCKNLLALLEKDISERDKDNHQSWQATARVPDPTIHAKVYAIADKYNVAGLKSVAIQKFEIAALEHTINKKFYDSINYVYTTTLEHDRGLRKVVAKFVCDTIERIGVSPTIQEKMRELPDLALDVVSMLSANSRSDRTINLGLGFPSRSSKDLDDDHDIRERAWGSSK